MIKILRRFIIFGFLSIILLFAGIWLFSDTLVKTAVEEGGTAATGAKVEVGSAHINWSPFAIELTELKIANPDKPMQNMVELGKVRSEVNLLPLIAGQIIVSELSATSVIFNTQRSTSGAIDKPDQTSKTNKQNESSFDLSGFKNKLPSADEIIAREPLSTPAKAVAFKETLKTSQKKLSEHLNNLPDDEKISDYEDRLSAITSNKVQTLDDLQIRKSELESIKNELRADKKALASFQKNLKTNRNDLKIDYAALKSAPKEDMKLIKERYSLDASGASNLTRLLFGNQAQDWFGNLQTWYSRLQSIMPESNNRETTEIAGKDAGLFDFAYDDSLPAFLVKHAQLAAILPIGDVNIMINNLTHQPDVLGKPLTLKALGKNLPNASHLDINGTIDHVNPKNTIDQLNWSIQDWRLGKFVLSESSSMPVTMAKSSSTATGNIIIKNKSLKGNFVADFNAVQWQVNDNNGWQGQVSQTLKTIDKFKLEGEIKGTVTSPSINISSDIDSLMKKAVSKQAKAKQSEVEKKIQSYLNDEIAKVGGPYEEQLSILSQSEGNIKQQMRKIEEMLKSEVESSVNEQKKKIQEKTKQELKNKLKNFKF